jgi:hypothetical protein
MVTSKQCQDKFGKPDIEFEKRHMVLWDVPADINAAIQAIPNKIYCNKVMIVPLEKALRNLMAAGLTKEVKTWDGCFNIRKKRGGTTMSLHSWAIAVDINAAWNQFGKKPTLSSEFVKCFTDAGFEWGGYWKKADGMHFELAKL